MKNEEKFITVVLLAFVIFFLFVIFSSQQEKADARQKERTETMINLAPNKKLVLVGWRQNNLWYLQREMREDEKAEAYEFIGEQVYGTPMPERKIIFREHQK